MDVAAAMLRALASPRRRAILRLVWSQERSAGEIAAAMSDVTFGAVSQHLRVLAAAGVVEVRRERQFRYYRARQSELAAVRPMLESMWNDWLWELKLAAELEHSRRGPKRKESTDEPA